ncbi:serine/threonine protein kinase [Nocardioides mangrovi]|uniref:non-specific serine/threonine protein kinase n=1 Tax=Nocardioides mangrovi TaxID=2874580 RepID=A0ABS7U9F7_9ACTN|nr:serine/threonine-protein kinase [Nocardioides mangrovi]MBZ5737614.1 serine/threonine-protein kinase [Nocardioides mangrovi]
MTDSVDAPVRLLDGRYELRAHLGSGGMGAVYRAHDLRLDREVAIKVLRDGPDDPRDPEDPDHVVRRARLHAEARLAGGLQHPGIVRVLDYGEERHATGRSPYVVMQHVPGRPLSAVLREDGVLPAESVLLLVHEVGAALAEAHAATVVHRDLKPSNIIVRPDGRPVLVDFGIARSDGDDPLTQTGEIIGTADYLSPEQVSGQRATPASDVYALGVVAYQCLTGTSPFHRETHVATALAHLHDAAPPLPDTVPTPLRDLVHQMLRQDPDQRPGAAEVSARARTATEPTTQALPAVARPAPTALWPFARPRGRSLAIAGAALVALVAGLVVWGIAGGDPVTPPAAAGVAVPDVVDEQVAEARQDLHDAGFEVDVRRVDAAAPAGQVLRQSPTSGGKGALRPPGSTVTLRVASGWVAIDPDTLVGLDVDRAAAALSRRGLVAVRAGTTASDAPVDSVVEVGVDDSVTRLRRGSTVPLVLAAAPVVTKQSGHPHPSAPGKAKGHGKPPKPPKPGKKPGKKPHP